MEVIVSSPRVPCLPSLPPAKRPQLPRRLRRSSSSPSSSSHLRQRLVLLSLLSLVLCSVAMEAEDGPVTSLESCMQKYAHFEISDGDVYCQWAWDTVLCWPPTRAGLTARQPCPRFKGIDPTKFAIKRCGVNGRWEGKTPGLGASHAEDIAAGAGSIDHAGSSPLGDGAGVGGGGAGDGGVSLGSSGHGWTNYTPCFTPEMRQLLEKLYSGSQDEAEVKFRIAERTRTLEIVGLGVSLAALLVSLAIFCHFRSLKNNRTRIHKNLFVAMVIQVVIRLTLYIDQAVIRTGAGGESAAAAEAATAAAAAAGAGGTPSPSEDPSSAPDASPPPYLPSQTPPLAAASPPPTLGGPPPTPAPPPAPTFFAPASPSTEADSSTFSSTTESVPTTSVAAVGMRRYRQGIDNTPILCEASYVFLEYARTAMFMWMFIEGLYLHNMITVTVFQEKSYYSVYTLVGWGVPVLMTAAWALTTAMHHGTSRCWWGYNLTLYFWILEGPRLGVILLNFLFLLNIIRVLVVKLRQSHTSEIEQVRKAVRAALVLLPLLGITNVVNMADAPLDRAAWEFALWSYGTHFLTSFQGLFIAFLYCFLNGEVRTAVGKSVSVYLSIRRDIFGAQQRRNSAFSSVFVADRGGGEDGEAGGGDGRGGESEGPGSGGGRNRRRGTVSGSGGEEDWSRRWRRRRSRRNRLRRASTAPSGAGDEDEEEEEEEEEEGDRRRRRRMSSSSRRSRRVRLEEKTEASRERGGVRDMSAVCWCCSKKGRRGRNRGRGGGEDDDEDDCEDDGIGAQEVGVGEVGVTGPDGGFYYCCRRGFVAVSAEPDAPETQV